jgi:hypothetical protein
MTRLSYALGMLTIAGMAGGAAQASAATTVTLDLAPLDPGVVAGDYVYYTPITLAGDSAPQFYYVTGGTYLASNSYFGSGEIVTAAEISSESDIPYSGTAYSYSSLGMKTSTPGLPTPGETYGMATITSSLFLDYAPGVNLVPSLAGAPGETLYIHAKFDPPGATYIGTFEVDPDGTVKSFTYTPDTSPAPEPDAWALLIAGTAMTGGMVRAGRSRRRQAAAA